MCKIESWKENVYNSAEPHLAESDKLKNFLQWIQFLRKFQRLSGERNSEELSPLNTPTPKLYVSVCFIKAKAGEWTSCSVCSAGITNNQSIV